MMPDLFGSDACLPATSTSKSWRDPITLSFQNPPYPLEEHKEREAGMGHSAPHAWPAIQYD